MIAQSEAEVTELNRLAAEHMAKARKAAGWQPGPERVRLSDGNPAQAGDLIQARLNDRLITAGGQWLANRDILQITRIYGHGHYREIEARRRLPDGTWTAKFTIPARYAEKSATLGYASTIYAAQGRTVDTAHALITQGMNREALYVAATRGRRENRLHVVTGPDHGQQQAAPETVLAQALSTPAAEQSATAELDAAMDHNDHPARLLYLYDEITAPERSTQLDQEFRARLDPADFARYMCDPVRPVLYRSVRQAQLGGHDTAAVLDQITRGSMDRARSIASVLHGRLQDLRLPERQQPAALAERLPEARREGLARQAALMMDVPGPGHRRAAGRPPRTMAGRPPRPAAAAARSPARRLDQPRRAGRVLPASPRHHRPGHHARRQASRQSRAAHAVGANPPGPGDTRRRGQHQGQVEGRTRRNGASAKITQGCRNRAARYGPPTRLPPQAGRGAWAAGRAGRCRPRYAARQ